ncbi:MAG TPA: M4 family metallopeptidase [Catenuloplanes sp.]|jgi:Zn-dependent metalloprotease
MSAQRRLFRRLAVAATTAALVAAGIAVVHRDRSAEAPATTATVAAGTPSATRAPGGPNPAAPANAPAKANTAAPVGSAKARPKPSRDRAVADARAVVRRHGKAVRAAKGETYQPRGVLLDADGARHVRFDRTHRGLPVLGGDYVVHHNPDGSFRTATVAQSAPISAGTEPAVNAAAATATAVRAFAGKHRTATPRLVIDARQGPPVLAWRVVVEGTGPDGKQRILNVIIDAVGGKVRRSFDDIKAAEAGTGKSLHAGEVPLSTTKRPDGSYELTDPARGGGQTRDGRDAVNPDPNDSEPFTDADNAWGSGESTDRATAAVDVHYGMAQAWDYFKEKHGRAGIHDDGKGLVALVHMADANAGWYPYCRCVKFGDGDRFSQPFTSLDIVAHEMAHGVTDATAALEYSGESGGLNEATSDIFGTLAEFHANNPADPPDYLVGEKLDIRGGSVPLRYLDDPARDGGSSSCFRPGIGDRDVHYSSGVANRFFHALAAGDGTTYQSTDPHCGVRRPVTGIGNDKAGQIWYRALTTYMVSNTDYAGARQATLNAAIDLFGADSTEYRTVDAAWQFVRVDSSGHVPEEPVVQSPGMQHGMVGDAVRLQIRAVDAQRDPLTFTARNLPPGLSISDSGLISGTPTAEAWEMVEVTVTDPAGHTGWVEFLWQVAGPPVVRNPGDQTQEVGQSVSMTIEAQDELSSMLTYAATGLPDGVSISARSGFISGSPTTVGNWRTSVTVTDATQLSTTVSFQWTITAAQVPDVPTDVVATRSSTRVLIRWKPPAKSPANPVTGYELTTEPGETVTLDSGTRSQLVNGLDRNVTYTFSIRAVNAAGRGPAVTVRLPAPPAPPAPAPARSAPTR